MKRFGKYAVGLMMGLAGLEMAMAGEAETNAWARNGWARGSGAAGATANWDGDDGWGIARTRTRSGDVSVGRGLAIGIDRDGLDFSFSHAIAGRFLPAYAGTFNLSIGFDGSVNGSYGGAFAQGGATRSAQAGGQTRSGGIVQARTNSYSNPVPWGRAVRLADYRRR